MGPNEKRVRESLADRSAAKLRGLSRGAYVCFLGFFNGGLREGWTRDGESLFIGKAECEWDWKETWHELKESGLIDWREETRDNHATVGGKTTYIYPSITELGHEVRASDLAYHRELMDAIDADEKAAA
jgi:hypothetical protein